ncbi:MULTISPECIES: serine/threonine-protein kinase [unclassified Curtobacterium]|uniref:serine/threonine-protein kinase n=1 Tax=unclassified Curtobacterium TaxID=257496 RepID=UPI000DA76EE0|nr:MULTISPECIES: serine/threonine-protein kinase [unclassified Curtobacterium]PZE28855.1 serine/threonine protein kinase [Curtobacterium sp. MCBD17_028]PZE77207.1 serine/threonine protein kinase [Curtobacterium sp. MCBD17_019]PZF59111.1 serine/threonine protein kinase [Curtobacterium sp. MCBD17_034]PZM34346.1 serine/threonine protein kinase [Curtobacterium sp. MCBD17_031]WIB62340.1 serine/threonine-protein kinase [Curtobacterium sp. MCBD17_040]
MARRLPSTPPVLPGFTYVHVLGSGGFADVFLYEQNMPRRQVAVKVLLDEVVDDRVRQSFQSEANLMARLSTHPSILTVLQASVAADGRPYLVMELCSASLSERYRRDPVPVSEVLAIGVRVGSALETAHREGVLHRDVKPSNILRTAYGSPVLSDFGIAASIGEADPDEPIGMSIPWSAPEVLMDESRGSVQSEVYSLAATVYSLLAGRSPFEVPGGANGADDLMGRIDKGTPKPTGRPDVPPSLERLLAAAMSRRPEQRPATAIEFVRGLQQVEAELGLPQTPAEVEVENWAMASVGDATDRTMLRNVAAPVAGGRRRRARQSPRGGLTTTASRSVGTVHRSASTARVGRRSRSTLLWAALAAVVVAVVAVSATLVLTRTGSGSIPTVSDIRATTVGTTVTFRWGDPGTRAGDTYVISSNGGTSQQTGRSFVVSGKRGDEECVAVAVNRDGKNGDQSAQKCVTIGDD